MTILLIGESYNRGSIVWRQADRMCLKTPEQWAEWSPRAGCFKSGPGRQRLLDVGLMWDNSMNLCPPFERWRPAYAKQVADLIVTQNQNQNQYYVLLGRRVQVAFGVDWSARNGQLVTVSNSTTNETCGLLCVPHPSGLNRVWNDEWEVALTESMIKRALSPHKRSCCLCKHPCWETDACKCGLSVCPRCLELHGKTHLGDRHLSVYVESVS
jgi:hypothetical protein